MKLVKNSNGFIYQPINSTVIGAQIKIIIKLQHILQRKFSFSLSLKEKKKIVFHGFFLFIYFYIKPFTRILAIEKIV